MGDKGFHLSSKTICPVCQKPIRRTKSDSYSCAAWLDFQPAHIRCAAATQPREMAAGGAE